MSVPEEPVVPEGGMRRRTALTAHPAVGRWTVVIVVIVIIFGIGALSGGLHPPAAAPAPATFDGVPVPPSNALSSSAFCAAGISTSTTNTIYLTNSTDRPVASVMTTVERPGRGGVVPTVHRHLTVPASGSIAVDPITKRISQGSSASSITFAGGGVVASQAVSSADGWSTAPCASRTSTQWYFAGGSTTSGHQMTLALFNPAAPPSVVNVSFLTPSGLVTPQAYQGLVIPSRGLVLENVGDFVQQAADIATVVTAQSGSLVASEVQDVSTSSATGLSIRLGSPNSSAVWQFAQTTNTTGSTVDFHLANPSSRAITATISADLQSGSVTPRQLSVPPFSIVEFAATAAGGLPRQVPYSLTVRSSAPMVVGRSVQASHGSSSPTFGSSAGTVTLTTQWLLPGPGVAGAPATANAAVQSLAVSDPGSKPAQVQVGRLGVSRPVIAFTVPPGRLVVLGSRVIRELAPYTVVSSQPVAVEEDQHPTGAPGIVSSTGFPVGG
jgi:Family of unknown function (DUF5719)